MTLSTSNSERGRKPGPPWSRVWFVATLVVIAVATGWDLTLRAAGLGPHYADNRALWVDARRRLEAGGPNAIALLGASRHQRAIDVQKMQTMLNRPVFQLAVEGTSALPTLEDLAADPLFRGTVIYSIAPAFSYNRKLSKLDGGNQAGWVRHYRQQSFVERVEQRLRLLFQGLLASRSPSAALQRVLPSVLSGGGLPEPDFKETLRDRSVHTDYALQTGRKDRQGIVDLYKTNSEPYFDDEFLTIINYFAVLVDLLQRKGVDVYIVRLPSDGIVLELEKEMFPRDRFWSRMEGGIDASFVHFEDYASLSGYLSGDGSHIESTAKTEFTEKLIDVLQSNGL